MSRNDVVDASELIALAQSLSHAPDKLKQALAATLNEFAKDVTDKARDLVESELNLSRSYINGKIAVSRRASSDRLEAVISSDVRPLLLSRFASAQEFGPGKTKPLVPKGVSVKVKRNGPRRYMPKAFMLPLKQGNGTRGIAIRPGAGIQLSPSAQRQANRLGYAVLHGPSVDQVFRTRLDDLQPDPEDMFAALLNKLETQR